jgi:hypothetical protein
MILFGSDLRFDAGQAAERLNASDSRKILGGVISHGL